MVIAEPPEAFLAGVHDDITTSTEYERESLGDTINLSDGHARQPIVLEGSCCDAIIDKDEIAERVRRLDHDRRCHHRCERRLETPVARLSRIAEEFANIAKLSEI